MDEKYRMIYKQTQIKSKARLTGVLNYSCITISNILEFEAAHLNLKNNELSVETTLAKASKRRHKHSSKIVIGNPRFSIRLKACCFPPV